ncbi:nuclear pore complex protein NUP62-like [Penaeus japonicus]|uniref:nuclear pore complex protein NUP62-like n=1 Tax=Penaeus japonicus TaxID=27405 RepID=UPI001C710169|nr:nuclear pore complex protein NUP62-like [Penaeus japonicus]XP_042868622.1 nuclear pore complex protein NUP62-like [Penaeus japonicus]
MAAWTSLVLLSVLAVSTLSLPRPDESAYRIPHVGTGRRSQYYVLHSDGTYKYGHDTGEGAFESARSSTPGQQRGTFGYVAPDGRPISLQYEAGEGGFVPQGAHLPATHPDFEAAHAEARARAPFVDPLADSNTDASYGFQFAEGGQARSEQSDSDGNVRGSYSYTDDQGRTRTYSYTAGRGTGFVVEGSDLPTTPEHSKSTPAATRLSSATRFPSSRVGTGHSPRSGTTSRGSGPSGSGAFPSTRRGGSPSGSKFPSAGGAVSSQRSAASPDGSYSFSFDAGDHSRSESADGNLNVEGQFSFVADDGVRRNVNYEAGANRGFQASGDHLPTAPQPHSTSFASHVPSVKSGSPASTFHRPSSVSTQRYSASGSPSSPSTRVSGRPFDQANTRSQINPDGGYSFSYQTSTHSRAESGDRDNNVDGNFAFVADDGQQRAIQYEAGSDTGFIAEGAHIPVGPEVPGAPSGQPTGRIVPVREIPFVDPLADTNADASYSFAFDSEQYSRSESADADGNVQGTYTLLDDEGTRRTYRFRAGEGVGFEAEELSASPGASPFRSSSPSSTAGTSYSHPSSSTFPASAPSTSSSSRYSTSASSAPSSTSGGLRSSSGPGFQLRQYDATNNPHKVGYVLTFDK